MDLQEKKYWCLKVLHLKVIKNEVRLLQKIETYKTQNIYQWEFEDESYMIVFTSHILIRKM